MAAVTDECRETFEEDIALRGRGRANSQWLRVFLKGAADPATFVNWPSCKEYDLVDAWEEEDQPLLGQAQYRMLPWPEVARFVAVPPPDDLYVSGARGVAWESLRPWSRRCLSLQRSRSKRRWKRSITRPGSKCSLSANPNRSHDLNVPNVRPVAQNDLHGLRDGAVPAVHLHKFVHVVGHHPRVSMWIEHVATSVLCGTNRCVS